MDALHRKVQQGVDPGEALHDAINEEMQAYREDDRALLHAELMTHGATVQTINDWTWARG